MRHRRPAFQTPRRSPPCSLGPGVVIAGLAGVAVGILLSMTCKPAAEPPKPAAPDPIKGPLGAGMLTSGMSRFNQCADMGMRLDMHLAGIVDAAKDDPIAQAFEAFDAACDDRKCRAQLARILKPFGRSR